MKKFFLILTTIILFSCSEKKYKYKVEGISKSKIRTGDFFKGYEWKEVAYKKIAHIDSISGFNEDSMWYYNSDGNRVVVNSPYIITDLE